MVGVRGPFGTAWPATAAEGSDVVIVAGGLGLAPLRPAIYQVLANRARYGHVVILYGTRTPERDAVPHGTGELAAAAGHRAQVTVDHADASWRGEVGVVPKLISRASFDPDHTIAMVCGPEVMMRFSAAALLGSGVPVEQIYVSMERNMKCAVGLCGHCQFGPDFICKDGPVMSYDRIASSSPSGRSDMAAKPRPRLAVWKFASCDGCQLSLLDCEDELLAVAGAVEIAYSPKLQRDGRGPVRPVAGRGLDHHGA